MTRYEGVVHRPFLSVALPLLAALLLACNVPAVSAAPPAGPVPFETVTKTAVPGQMGQERREVFRDAASWRAAWAELRKGSSLPEEPPAVDFAKEMVVLAAMGTQACVSEVTIRTITAGAGELAIDILEEPSGPKCTCITSQRPFHAVRTQKSPSTPRFLATVQPKDCTASQ